jgi:hypothetical protein
MKRNKIFGFLAGALLMAPAATFAQQALRSGYFLEGYEYRHVMNPAFGPDRKGFVSFPFLGNINVGMSGNMGVSNFLYKTPDGGLTTFLNESVTASDFLGGINQNNRLAIDYNWSIFSMGFSKFGGYNTIGINLRTNVSATLPYELFEFMKVGGKGDNTVYHMENIGVSSKAYVELALGHSRDINEQWRVGGKLKFLLGGLNASAMIDRMDVEMTDEQWKVQGSGSLDLAMKGLKVPTNGESKKPGDYEADKAQNINYSDIELESPGLGGFGMAIDLGATYQLREDLQLSASLLDLGFISWNSNTHGVMSMEPWVFDGFKDVPYNSEDDMGNEKPNSLENQIDNLTEGLEDYFSFQREGEVSSRTTALGATLNLGALYTFPYYEGLKFGFLSSTRIQGKYSWSEGRFSANVAPTSWFDASVNYGISSYGSSFGWLINFHPNKFNFFIGSDHQFVKITPQFLPVNNANMSISMGINFNL